MKVILAITKEILLYVCLPFFLIWGYVHYQETRIREFEFSISCNLLVGFSRLESVDTNGKLINMVIAFDEVGDRRFNAYQIDPPYSGSLRGFDSFHERHFYQTNEHYIAMLDWLTTSDLADARMILDRKSLILTDDSLRPMRLTPRYWQCSEINALELQIMLDDARALPGTEGNRI